VLKDVARLFVLAALTATGAFAQTADETGWTGYTSLQGSVQADSSVLKWDSSVGYNVSRHFGMDFGVPFYFSHADSSLTGSSSSGAGIGDAYLNFRGKFLNPKVNYGTNLLVGVPTGSRDDGFSTGRMTVDWTNRFDRTFGRITPFGEIGFANTTGDTRVYTRSYTSLGFVTHMQGGASLALTDKVSIGGSAFAILPSGDQKIYSKVVNKGKAAVGNGSHGRSFEQNYVTSGGSDLAKDHGLSTWVDISPNKYFDISAGYTRSTRFDLNTFSFGIGLNLGSVWKRSQL
jgi:hypothetical protein